VKGHLYHKFKEELKRTILEFNRADNQFEAEKRELLKIISRKFRLNKNDISIAMKELEKEKRLVRINQRKVRLKP